MAVLICPECGAENRSSEEYCIQCNASLNDVKPTGYPDLPISEEEEASLLDPVENDLPELLHALKQDEEMTGVEQEMVQDEESASQEGDQFFDGDSLDAQEEDVPEWLHRIRQRASEEPDSKGEITQKIAAALDNLADEKSQNHHESYQSWINRVRKQDGIGEEEVPGDKIGVPVSDDETGEVDQDWLTKIRQAEGKQLGSGGEEPALPSDQKGDSLLQWLVALEEGTEQVSPFGEESNENGSGFLEKTHPLQLSPESDATQEIELAGPGFISRKAPELIISREEQIEADQLSATIVDEKAARPTRKPVRGKSRWILRTVVMFILVLGLSLALFLGGEANIPEGLLQAQNVAVLSWAEALPEETSILIIFDYQPAFSEEISLVAKPILETIVHKQTNVSVLSSSIFGSALSQRLLTEMDHENQLIFSDLGYFPTAAYGAYSLASGAKSGASALYLPEQGKMFPPEGFDNVLILSDNAEGVRVWVEQLSTLMPDTPVYLALTAQAGPMSLPYWESGQVDGLVSGISEAAGLEATLTDSFEVAVRWRAYQVGIVIVMVFMVFGAIFMGQQASKDQGKG